MAANTQIHLIFQAHHTKVKKIPNPHNKTIPQKSGDLDPPITSSGALL